MKKVAIYCRVSGSDQDISYQQKSLPEYAKKQGWEIFKIYSDDAISGASDDRPAFAKLLKDLINDKFDILLVEEHDRISRSGDMAERGMILQTIKKHNVMLWSPSEGSCDLSGFAGEITSSIKLIIAAEERKNIIKRTVRGKKAKLKSRKPTVSADQLPYGRIYDKEKDEWSLDPNKHDLIKEAASRYLNGESLRKICEDLEKRGSNIKYVALLRLLKDHCGDTWTIKYKKHPEGLYNAFEQTLKIPRLLSDETIEAIRKQIKFNTTFVRGDSDYLLKGYLRCSNCGRALTGQYASTTIKGKKYKYRYYRHPIFARCGCKALHGIKAEKIENAVFEIIFQNVYDEVGFNKAIREYLPDAKMISELKSDIEIHERRLKRIEKDLKKLVDIALKGTLSEETISFKESELLGNRKVLTFNLKKLKERLSSMPDIEKVEKEAERIRLGLLDYFGDVETFKSHGYKHKREFLRWFFDGEDEDGYPCAIYLTKRGKNYDFTIYGKIVGTMTIYKDRVDYPEHILPDTYFKQCLTNFVPLKHP